MYKGKDLIKKIKKKYGIEIAFIKIKGKNGIMILNENTMNKIKIEEFLNYNEKDDV